MSSRKAVLSIAVSCSLALTSGLGAGAAYASEISGVTEYSSTSVTVSGKQGQPKVSPSEFEAGLAELVSQGKLKLLSSKETPTSTITSYGVVDPGSGKVFMTFVTDIPKYRDRIWGAMWGWEPALTFNQENQKDIATGGAAAVTAMAAAAAAALSETVVGSIISAGVIGFVGGVATSYISKHGHCPAARPTLWVGTVSGTVACR